MHHGHSSFSEADDPHFEKLVNDSVSKLAPYAGLILTTSLVIIILGRLYIINPLVLRIYKAKYTGLSESNRRGFINHHIAAILKITLLLAGAYPFLYITTGNANPHTAYAGSRSVTLGDVLVVCSEIFIAMYIFELCYRPTVSPLSTAHHIGAMVIAQSAITITINFDHEKDATFEFILCLLWGTFDVAAELWPHIAMIIYRICPSNHLLLAQIFRSVAIIELCSTIVETALVMWLFGLVWSRWTLPFKVITPILHVIFSAAQLWGVWIFRQLELKERKKSKEQ